MGIEHQLARLTARTPPFKSLPVGGIPEITSEMIAQASANHHDLLAYHLVMGKYTDSVISKKVSIPMIHKESRKLWAERGRGRINKKTAFNRITIMAYLLYYIHGDHLDLRTATKKARFCGISTTAWHDRWCEHFEDLMVTLSTKEGALLRFIARNIWDE